MQRSFFWNCIISCFFQVPIHDLVFDQLDKFLNTIHVKREVYLTNATQIGDPIAKCQK